MRRYYPGITIFKLVGSVLVVFSHIGLPEIYKALTGYVTGLNQILGVIVPCFYMVAGFLAYKGWTHARSSRRYITHYLTWLLAIYGLFCIAYIGTAAVPYWLHGAVPPAFTEGLVKGMLKLFFVNAPYPQLWFIPPLLFGVSITYFFIRKGRFATAAALAVAGFVAAQLMSGTFKVAIELLNGGQSLYHGRHAGLLEWLIVSYFGLGYPFVLLGAFISKHEERFLAIRGRRLAAFSLALTFAEGLFLYVFVGGRYQYYLVLSVLPLSALLFHRLLTVKMPAIQPHHQFINRLSMVIYFFHMALIKLNLSLFNWQSDYAAPNRVMICLLLTITEAVLITRLMSYYMARTTALRALKNA